eukprot:Nitzschia sp. Nitz4//scaffold22_size323478//198018//199406//NITZ4_000554-RA/size323478-snap-gene-0.517-mRNA-1//1//CDS//3329543076//318//frame0
MDQSLPLEESLPFAFSEANMPQNELLLSPQLGFSTTSNNPSPRDVMVCESPIHSHSSSPPALAESSLTESSSARYDSDGLDHGPETSHHNSTSPFLVFSSLPTIPSIGGADSMFTIESGFSGFNRSCAVPPKIPNQPRPQESMGFSQLLREAEADSMPTTTKQHSIHGNTASTLSVSFAPAEALISSPTTIEDPSGARRTNDSRPLHFDVWGRDPQQRSAWSVSPRYDQSLTRAKTNVRAMLVDPESFEVSTIIPSNLSIQEVTNVVGDPDKLSVWCESVQGMVLTGRSDHPEGEAVAAGETRREYDGEWIVASTPTLHSPEGNLELLNQMGRSFFDMLGLSELGTVTMFVEKQRGQIGLTVGPFAGGVRASHTIRVSKEREGSIRIVDTVSLSKETEAPSYFSILSCGAFDSCLSTCVLPSVTAHMEQATTSMAKLRLLVEARPTTLSHP